MCIYGDVDCQLASCLNTCNEKLENDGNNDDFKELSVSDSESGDDFMVIDYVEDGDEIEGILFSAVWSYGYIRIFALCTIY